MIELNGKQAERAILVGVASPKFNRWEIQDHLHELEQLADTAGAEVVEQMVQERKQFDPAYYIGKGKVSVLSERAEELDAQVVIFDDDLTPAQTRNLEKLIKKKVIDRSGLILDIFARRAKTREARTQVELAQLRYLLPRLTRQWTHLSRQVGGIGTRGPGETQLEVDRRLIRKRISILEDQLVKIERQRELRRKHRSELFAAALVGYTNVGKSTLLNALTKAEVFVENRLFATLDATVRSVELASHETVLMIDTVGFIRKLPHHLVASFKSTLEEARDADLLLHVVDITHPQFEEQMATVHGVLQELDLAGKTVLHVFNKIDAVENPGLIAAMREKYAPAVFISAARGLFLGELRATLLEYSHARERHMTIVLEAGDGQSIARVYELAEVIERTYDDYRVQLRVRTTQEKAALLEGVLKAKDRAVEFIPA